MAELILQNERLKVEIATPGETYRRSRYDWTGMVTQVTLDGTHTFFAPEVVEGLGGRGLVDLFEFKNTRIYEETEIADRFPLIGVGLLKKGDFDPFCFFKEYDVQPFHREWREIENGYLFDTFPTLCQGVAIRQKKELTLDGATLVMRHTIRNVGEKAVELQSFNHNFFCFDNAPIDSNYELHLPYKPLADVRRGRLSVGSHSIRLDEFDPGDGETAFVLHGYEQLKESSLVVENKAVGLGVSVDEDFPSIRSYNWVCAKAFCPETFCDLTLEPGQEKQFTRRYTFYVL